jgi:asparagine synthase (glutamine-hydrolysing)
MCGITGIFCFGKDTIDRNELLKFTDSLTHRGPEERGLYLNNNRSLGLGHRMLSIFDPEGSVSQPMSYFNNNNEIIIVFNGAIYNFIELKNELKNFGYKFKTNCDTEVILAAYLKWGDNCEKKFNGMWAYAIWDTKKKLLTISRDRFGVKPVYYTSFLNRMYFASEIKSFLFINNKYKPQINYSQFLYMSKNWYNNSYISSENTFLKNVKELPSGFKLVVGYDSKINIYKWWSTKDNIPEIPKNENEQVENFKQLFLNSCKVRMRSDVPVAATLSGGLDSSSIVSSINYLYNKNIIKNKISTFFLNYQNDLKSNLDAKYALEVSRNVVFKNYVLEFGEKSNYTDDLIKIIYHKEDIDNDDGLGPWYLYKFIKKNNFKVVIEGHGGDELLAGYKGYIIYALEECKTLSQLNYKIDLIITNLRNKIPFLQLDLFLDFIYVIIKKKIKLFFQSKYETNFLVNEEISKTNLNIEESNFFKPLNKELYRDFHFKSLPINLKKHDRLAMAHGLEIRSPFLDWELVTYSFGLPSSQKIKNGQNKKILRRAMKDLMPEKVINRSFKSGFNMENNLFNRLTIDFIKETFLSRDFLEIPIFDKKKLLKFINDKRFNTINMRNLYHYIQIYYLTKKFS